MATLEKTDIQLGYVPMLDCTAILWAQHQGYFAAQGLMPFSKGNLVGKPA